ncbi:Uma2 family endonuclease [Thiobacillus denitrificans]|uniref:Uma2 family endonuclease n=1 Tax=Thiobacillus denitrificans TaxID=36861 RepID=UPI000377CD87|nr:Uma2 family endonuclease [Thiobacillus denitrificans]
MSQAHVHSPIGEADYLHREEAATSKHELVDGDIFAMAGASERHNRIAGNIFFHLRSATRGKNCRAFMADMKLRLASGSTYYYPDAMLVCDPADDHTIYFRDEHGVWFEQELSPEDRLDVACGDARLALSLDDLYEDTGLLVV